MRHPILVIITMLGILSGAGLILPERYEIPLQAEATTAPADPVYHEITEPALRRIATHAGTFWLGYENGEARLSGAPSGIGGCGDWTVETFGGGDIVEFRIVHGSAPEEVCLKGLGQEPTLNARAAANSDTLYLILIGEEVVYAGQLSREPVNPII